MKYPTLTRLSAIITAVFLSGEVLGSDQNTIDPASKKFCPTPDHIKKLTSATDAGQLQDGIWSIYSAVTEGDLKLIDATAPRNGTYGLTSTCIYSDTKGRTIRATSNLTPPPPVQVDPALKKICPTPDHIKKLTSANDAGQLQDGIWSIYSAVTEGDLKLIDATAPRNGTYGLTSTCIYSDTKGRTIRATSNLTPPTS